MAMAINKVIVIGNLGANPTVRTLPNSGQNVANFSLATTERFTDRNGTKQERTEWHRVVAFGRLADTCERFLSKGRQVYVEGRLTTRQYEAKDGSGKRKVTEIVAMRVQFLSSRGGSMGDDAGDFGAGRGRASNVGAGAGGGGGQDDMAPLDDEDIPF